MFGITHAFPSYLMHGFGQDTSTTSDVQSWITDIMKPIADVVKEYYDLQYQQNVVQAQKVVQSTAFPSISPIYLIAGGLVIWYLFRGGIKGSEKGQVSRKRRRKAR